MFDERSLFLKYQQEKIRRFQAELVRIDREQGAILEKEGWHYKETAKRAALFTLGYIPLNRRCYEKDGVRRYPVDEYLGLEPYARFSNELLYQIAVTLPSAAYRKVVEHFKTILGIKISRGTVVKARKMVDKLYQEKEEYRFFEDEAIEKIFVDVLYLEADGLRISTPDGENEQKKTDFSHFLIHEGIEKEYGKRGKSVNKHEIWEVSSKMSKGKALDYLHNHYETKQGEKRTLLITNSDMGPGYGPEVFEDIARAMGCRHEHFWDRYHLNKYISECMKLLNCELEEQLLEAVDTHNKEAARKVLKTALKQLVGSDEEIVKDFKKFKRRLLRDFKYTCPPELRGLSPRGIGIMESNHTKLSYRLKKQARHFTVQGALTLGKMIIDKEEGTLRDLFFGDWRIKYAKHKSIEKQSVSQFLRKGKTQTGLKRVKQANRSGRRIYR